MTHPQHLHATTAAWSLHTTRHQLAQAVDRERQQQRADAVTTAAAHDIQAWRPVIGRASGGHGDPVLGTIVSIGDARSRTIGPGSLARTQRRVDEQLYWVTRGLTLDRVAQLIPRTSPAGAAILGGWLAGLAAEIRTALGLDQAEEILPGTECPACGMRPLRAHAAASSGWVTVCRPECLCTGLGCSCGMAIRVEGVAHVWPMAAVGRVAA